MIEIDVPAEAAGERLDRFLAAEIADTTRSRIERWIEEEHVRVDGKPSRPGHRLRGGERIAVSPPAPKTTELVAQEIPVRVLWEDDDLVAVMKPAGLVVHPAPGHPDSTLVNALLGSIAGLAGVGDRARPGILHRLDRDTTGVMLVAKNDLAFQGVARQISARTIGKFYTALVWGRFAEASGEIDRPLGRHPKDRKRMAVVPGGKASLTRWTKREELPRTTLLDIHLVTGRTHQIRVHFASISHPVVGDVQYGAPHWNGIQDKRLRDRLSAFPRQALHARRLEFVHPRSGAKIAVEAPLPDDFEALLKFLREYEPRR